MSRLISLVGTPSPLFYATLAAARALATAAFGKHDAIYANSLADLQARLKELPRAHERCIVLHADYPRSDMLAAFAALTSPLVICADDFVTTAHFSVVSRGYGGVDAARFASMGLTNIEPIISAPPRLSLIVNDGCVTVGDLVARLAGLYDVPLDAHTRQAALDELGRDAGGESLRRFAERTLPSLEPARAILDRRGPLESELIDGLEPHYGAIARGRRLEGLEWPPFALLRPDFPDRLTVGPIDLTGPARFIYYGPYFGLPPGRWRAELILEVSECLSDNHIAIDVVGGAILAAVKAKLPPQGVFGCEIAFELQAPSDPVEIRMQLLTGAIEGLLMVRSIRLTRSASEPANGPPVRGAS